MKLADSFHKWLYIIFRFVVLIMFGIFRAKIIKLWRTYFSTMLRSCILYVFTGPAASFTNPSGGNLVDGLPEAYSSELNITFRFYCCNLIGVANLFWQKLLFSARLWNINKIETGFIEFGGHSVENLSGEISKLWKIFRAKMINFW